LKTEGKTFEDIGAKLGVSRQTVSNWFCEPQKLSLENLGKIRRSLHIAVDDMRELVEAAIK
jgi:transcriptional regulator with XRE-family HTH domain